MHGMAARPRGGAITDSQKNALEAYGLARSVRLGWEDKRRPWIRKPEARFFRDASRARPPFHAQPGSGQEARPSIRVTNHSLLTAATVTTREWD